MYLLSYIKHGTGNKIFMLLDAIKIFKTLKRKRPLYWNKLYIVHGKSHHEKGIKTEQLDYIFPKLKELDWLEFISWKQFDSLKKNAKEFTDYTSDGPLFMNPSLFWNSRYFTEQPTFVKTYLKFNPAYEPLLKKYDTKKGILIHYRLGDKFEINYNLLIRNKNPRHILYEPGFFIKHVQRMLEQAAGPIYLASDVPKIAECLLKPSFPDLITLKEDAESTLYLMSKFKRMIITESTMSAVGGYLNVNADEIIASKYYIDITNHKLIPNPYMIPEIFTLDPDKKHLLLTLEQHKAIIKDCNFKFNS
jgi:hypothetical protein